MDAKHLSVVGPHMIDRIEAMARQTPSGIFVELGVFRGGTARTLANVAEEQGREIHLFDTFTGIPFKGPRDVHCQGDFSATSEKEVRELIPTAIFHVGIFPTTMPDKLGHIAFCHIDADQEQSYRDAIRLFSPLMVECLGCRMRFQSRPAVRRESSLIHLIRLILSSERYWPC